MLGHLRTKTLNNFKDTFEKPLLRGDGFAIASHECSQAFLTKFGKGCEDATIRQPNWDPSKVHDKLKRDTEVEILSVRATRISELTEKYENKLSKALREPVEALLETSRGDTWPAIRNDRCSGQASILRHLNHSMECYRPCECPGQRVSLQLFVCSVSCSHDVKFKPL